MPSYPHHVTQRGNRKADIFIDDADRYFYLNLIRIYALKHGVEIWAYCLMSNHVHFIVVPATEFGLGALYHDAHSIYTRHFNDRAGMCGHVFQSRYYSSPLDEDHALAAVRYVERNPVRARLVEHASDYPWSSARAHCGIGRDPLVAGSIPPSSVIENWSDWLRDPAVDVERAIRRSTQTGRPCGNNEFVSKLEAILKRPLRPGKRGRRPVRNSGTGHLFPRVP